MSIEVEVKSTGWQEVFDFMGYLEITLPNEVTIGEIRWILEKAKEYAKSIVPVRTGELRDSIDILIDESKKSGILFATADHAPYVELGTSKMTARPYMLPAIIFALQEFQRTFPDRFKGVVETT